MVRVRFTLLFVAMLIACLPSLVLSHIPPDIEEKLNQMQDEIDTLREENEELREEVQELKNDNARQDATNDAQSEVIAEGEDHDRRQDSDAEISETGGLLGPLGTIIAREIKKIINRDPPYYEGEDDDDGPPPILVPLPPPPERPSGQYDDDYRADGEEDEEEEEDPPYVPPPPPLPRPGRLPPLS